MNHKHRKVLHALFSHPVSGNINFSQVESVLKELGADMSSTHTSKVSVTLNGHTANFRHANHSMPPQEVTQVRKFIETCGIDPKTDYPL